MSEKLLNISINKNLIDKYKPENHYHLAHGFEPVEVTISQLEKLVGGGYCFSYQFANQYRKTDNFLQSDILAIDMDGGRTISECFADPIVKNYCSLFYTTPRHTPEHHRFRLVFELPRTITNVNELKNAALALSRRLGGDLTATDGARMFYGSSLGKSQLLGNAITDDFLTELIIEGNDRPENESISNKGKTTNFAKKQIDPKMPITRADGIEVLFKDIKEKTSVFCPHHPDQVPRAKVSVSRKSQSRYLVCSKCNMLWWEKNTRFAKFDFDGFENTVRKIKNGDIKKDARDLNPIELYSGLNQISANNIHVTNDEFLELSEIKDGLTIVKSPKGTGKTTYLSRVLKKITQKFGSFEEYEKASFDDPNVPMYSNERILLIGHRQALIGDLCKRLHLNSYLDDYLHKKQEITHRRSRYGLCLDSLWKVNEDKYDIIVIDEVEQVLGHFLSETMGARRESIFRTFTELLRNAKKIVVLDADISWISFNTLYSLITDVGEKNPNINSQVLVKKKPLPVHVYINDWKQKDRSINMFPSSYQLMMHIKSSILDGKRIFVASNSKKKIKILEKIVSELSREAGIDIPCIAVTSDNSGSKSTQKFIKNIQKEILDYKVIMSSPSLGTGIDITFDNKAQEIDIVYGLFENKINSHFEIDQQLARVRHPKEVNVWVCSSRHCFATDIAVVADDCLKSNLINNVEEGIVYDSEFEQSGISPFLKMAAMIVMMHRSSKNNLKNNFVNYKKSQNWKVSEVARDGTYRDGEELYLSNKGIVEFETANSICNAPTLNEYQHSKFLERIETFNESAGPQEWQSLIKTNIELFYGVPATPGLVAHDLKERYRKKVRWFESIQKEPELTHEEAENLTTKKARKLAKTRLEVLPDRHAGSSLLYLLLSKTPFFANGVFDPAVVFSKYDLKGFAELSIEFRKFVNTQLGVSTRSDVAKKSVQHLGQILKIIGLETDSCDTKKSGGKKTYYYKLKPDDLSEMLEVTKRRSIHEPESNFIGWAYVNKLHGFEYTEEEVDWLSRR